MTDYTNDQKQAMYRAGEYEFKAPPVCTARWDEGAWIRYIDKAGRWLPEEVTA